MDAPECQKIPSCGKRHYGDCASASSQEREPRKARPKKSSGKIKLRKDFFTNPPPGSSDLIGVELLARVESLEERVLELEGRKKYMRDYMRERRK